jgi:hypothetical protein
MDTDARGFVTDGATGSPIAGARVIELAIHKKDQEVVAEGLTDSTGTFDFSAGMIGFGLRKTRLVLLIDEEGYYPATVPNEGGEITVALRHY